ncbi:MAG: cysteine synthase family protein [Candidatus Eremiobacterota bacterium]
MDPDTSPCGCARAARLSRDFTQAVGAVPIVRLHRLSSICRSAYCYLKLEGCNPGGSIKEKNAVFLVDQAEARGELLPGGTIIESSSGNFGVALAMIGAARGYRVIIVVDKKTTPAFRRTLMAYGAELEEVSEHLADPSGSMQRARMARARELAEGLSGAWYPCQHLNPDNPRAHALYTAREIHAAFPEGFDCLVVGVSTGGQLSGLASYLCPLFPSLKVVAVDVSGSVILGTPPAPYKMTGVGLAFRPPNLNYGAIHTGYVVPETLAYSVCHALARREGLLLGASTGAIVAAGLRAARDLPPGSQVLMLNPDRGERYLDTVYNPDWLTGNGFSLIPPEGLEEAVGNLEPVPVPCVAPSPTA